MPMSLAPGLPCGAAFASPLLLTLAALPLLPPAPSSPVLLPPLAGAWPEVDEKGETWGCCGACFFLEEAPPPAAAAACAPGAAAAVATGAAAPRMADARPPCTTPCMATPLWVEKVIALRRGGLGKTSPKAGSGDALLLLLLLPDPDLDPDLEPLLLPTARALLSFPMLLLALLRGPALATATAAACANLWALREVARALASAASSSAPAPRPAAGAAAAAMGLEAEAPWGGAAPAAAAAAPRAGGAGAGACASASVMYEGSCEQCEPGGRAGVIKAQGQVPVMGGEFSRPITDARPCPGHRCATHLVHRCPAVPASAMLPPAARLLIPVAVVRRFFLLVLVLLVPVAPHQLLHKLSQGVIIWHLCEAR